MIGANTRIHGDPPLLMCTYLYPQMPSPRMLSYAIAHTSTQAHPCQFPPPKHSISSVYLYKYNSFEKKGVLLPVPSDDELSIPRTVQISQADKHTSVVGIQCGTGMVE